MTDALADKLRQLPTGPGVYQHKAADGTVLYVGKAKNLRNRVRSYFQDGRPREARIQALVKKIDDVEVIVTDTEAESLLLENNLIKRLKPRYNVLLKDDKSYPYICIKNERFPRVFPTRKVRRDGSEYFGPYTDAKAMNLMLKTIKDLFQLRSCSLHLNQPAIEAGKYQPCLDYHIQKCAAPCVGYESEAHYNQTIDQIRRLLNGKTGELIALLKDEMGRLAGERQFEEAAATRDRIQALETYAQRQKVVTDPEVDRDLFALAVDRERDAGVGVLFKVREGKIIGRQHKTVRGIEGAEDAELLQRFVEAHYAEATFLPNEVYLAGPLADPSAVESLLRERKGKRVEVRTPQRGEKVDLMNMVEANARLLLGEWQLAQEKRDEDRVPRSVLSLQRDLRLKRPPRRIECFDISHLGGTGTVASCVVFQDGKPRKSDYRTYKIRTVESGKPDDFQSMREVVERRYARLLGGERAVAGPGHHRRRQGPALVGRRVAPARRRLWQVPRRGAGEAAGGGVLPRPERVDGDPAHVVVAPAHPAGPRRGAPVRRDRPAQAAPDQGPPERALGHPRRRRGDGQEAADPARAAIKAVKAATEAEIAAVTGPAVARNVRQHYDGPAETQTAD